MLEPRKQHTLEQTLVTPILLSLAPPLLTLQLHGLSQAEFTLTTVL